MSDLTEECKLVIRAAVERGLNPVDATAVFLASLVAAGAAAGYSPDEIKASFDHEWRRYLAAARQLIAEPKRKLCDECGGKKLFAGFPCPGCRGMGQP